MVYALAIKYPNIGISTRKSTSRLRVRVAHGAPETLKLQGLQTTRPCFSFIKNEISPNYRQWVASIGLFGYNIDVSVLSDSFHNIHIYHTEKDTQLPGCLFLLLCQFSHSRIVQPWIRHSDSIHQLVHDHPYVFCLLACDCVQEL